MNTSSSANIPIVPAREALVTVAAEHHGITDPARHHFAVLHLPQCDRSN